MYIFIKTECLMLLHLYRVWTWMFLLIDADYENDIILTLYNERQQLH